jgi:hypothetical protein
MIVCGLHQSSHERDPSIIFIIWLGKEVTSRAAGALINIGGVLGRFNGRCRTRMIAILA